MEEENPFDFWEGRFRKAQEYRTPSASSGPIHPFEDVGTDALSAARDVSDLRQNKRTEPRGAFDGDNLCYRNSVLLTLLCNDSFMGFIRNHWKKRHRTSISEQSSTHESTPFELLSDIWEDYWASDVSRVELNKKLEEIWGDLTKLPNKGHIHGWNPPLSFPGQQDDAQDFLQWMIQYEEECASNLGGIFDDYMRLFTLPLTNWRICVGCASKEGSKKRVRHRPDLEVYSLSLKLPAGATAPQQLHELVQDHLKHLVDGWFCDQCTTPKNGKDGKLGQAEFPLDVRNKMRNTNAKGTKGPPEWKYAAPLPEVLFMHLDRGSKHNISKKAIKISTEVEIPSTFTFESGWLDPDYHHGDRELVERDYKLTGVIAHRGKSVNRGHYKTNVLVDGQWYDIDGDRCRKSDLESARTNKHGFDPVILVWQKQSQGMNDVTLKTSGAAQQTAAQNTVSKDTRTSAQPKDGSPGRQTIARKAGSDSRSSNKARKDPETPPPGTRSARRKESGRPSPPAPATRLSVDDSEFYLKLKFVLDEDSYLLHHKLKPLAGILHNTLCNNGPQVKIDARLLYEARGSQTTYDFDLLEAAKREVNGYKIITGDTKVYPWVPHEACACGEVHEVACRNLKRKVSAIEPESSEAYVPEKRRKALPALFQRRGDDPYNYPSIEERYKIQEAIDHALECQQKWKDWTPPVIVIERQALKPVNEAVSALPPRQRDTLGLPPSPRLLDALSNDKSSEKPTSPASVPAHQVPVPVDGPADVATPHTPPNQMLGGIQQSDTARSKTPRSKTPMIVPKDKSSPFGVRHPSRSPAEQRVADSQDASVVADLKNNLISRRSTAGSVIYRTPDAIQADDGDLNMPPPAKSESKIPAKSDSGSGRAGSQRRTSIHNPSPLLLEGTVIQHDQDQPLDSNDEETAQANDSAATQHPPPFSVSTHVPQAMDNDDDNNGGDTSDSKRYVPGYPNPPRGSPGRRSLSLPAQSNHTRENSTPLRRISSAPARSDPIAIARPRRSSAARASWANRMRQPIINSPSQLDTWGGPRYIYRSLGWAMRHIHRYPKSTTAAAVLVTLIIGARNKPKLLKRILAMLVKHLEALSGLTTSSVARVVELCNKVKRLAGVRAGEAAELVEEILTAIKVGLGDPEARRQAQANRQTGPMGSGAEHTRS